MFAVEIIRDSIFGGELTLWQPAKGHGYRFNLDPVLLSGFAPAHGEVLDLGGGCGVLGLLMLARGASQVIIVEREPAMAELIEQNAKDNGFVGRVRVLCADVRHIELPPVDHVVSNPPYFKAGAGRPAKNAMQDAARFERHGVLQDFVKAACTAVKQNGTVSFVLRFERQQELQDLLLEHGATTTRLTQVLARKNKPPRLALVQAVKGAAEQLVLDEWVLHPHEKDRTYTDEVNALVGPTGCRGTTDT